MLGSEHKDPLDLLATTARREKEDSPAFRALMVSPAGPVSRERRAHRAHQDPEVATANLAPGEHQGYQDSKDTREPKVEKARLEILVNLVGTESPESQDSPVLKEPKESGA